MSLIEFLSEYTYRTVVTGTTAIGIIAGVLGCFLYLRRQSLLSDVIGHSATLGVMLAFLFSALVLGIDGRSMVVLVIGSMLTGVVAVMLSTWISRTTPLGEEVAMAIILALFFGGGMALLRVIEHSSIPGRGGLADYLFGNASTMTREDVNSIIGFGIILLAIVALFWKEFSLFTFDPLFTATIGFSHRVLNPVMFSAIVCAVVLGLKAAGLVLMVAFAIVPPAAARQWVRSLRAMVVLSGVIGAVGAVVGTWLSVSIGRIPTGPMIVIVLTAIFLVSLFFAPGRSTIMRAVMRRRKRIELEKVA